MTPSRRPWCTTSAVDPAAVITSPSRRRSAAALSAIGAYVVTRRAAVLGEANCPGVIGAHDEETARLHPGEELPKRRVDGSTVAVVIQVVGLHVGDDRHERLELEEGAVTLVRLRDEQVAAAVVGVHSGLREAATDREGRVRAAVLRGHGEHRGRCRLAVGARDRHPPSVAHHLGQRLGTLEHPATEGMRLRELDVRAPDGRGHHNGLRVGDVRPVVADMDRCAQGLQRSELTTVLGVAARHRHAASQHDPGDPGHARTADADEVHTSEVSEIRAHATASRTRSTSCSSASRRPNAAAA